MTDQQREVAAARTAAKALLDSVNSLRRRFGDTTDMRRLSVDAARIVEDLDLLVGPEPRGEAAPHLVVIPEGEYPRELFEGADDEGVGPHR
jgi:hypothetical protein